MTPEQIASALFIFAFGLFLGRAWERCSYCSDVARMASGIIEGRWLAPSDQAAVLHRDQDAVGDMPDPPKEERFGPKEPRWWMRYITNDDRRAPQVRKSA